MKRQLKWTQTRWKTVKNNVEILKYVGLEYETG